MVVLAQRLLSSCQSSQSKRHLRQNLFLRIFSKELFLLKREGTVSKTDCNEDIKGDRAEKGKLYMWTLRSRHHISQIFKEIFLTLKLHKFRQFSN